MAGEGSLSVNTAVATKKVKGAWTLKRLLYLLDMLEKYDTQVEKKQSRSGWAAAFCFIASIVDVIIWNISEIDAVGYLSLIFLLLFVYFLISYRGCVKKDLPNDFRDYLIPLLKLLSADIEDRSKIALNMDIAQLRRKEYSSGVKTEPHNAPYYKITSELFERPLMTLAIHLRDGNRILMERFESLTVVVKKKKNPRGKIKTKEKIKRRVLTRMRLVVNPRVYAVRKNILTPAGTLVSSKAGAKRVTLDMRFAEKGGSEVGMKPALSIRQIAFLYSCIAPAKRNRGDNRIQ
ncbi:MAG: hypothetical protein HQK86_13235 [Nitrospinae bacterium]|nr:hypothetical protein [Nitrospinota bacterium]MBF0635075.1 hypothetical protein [Nitrospinota bacterium]